MVCDTENIIGVLQDLIYNSTCNRSPDAENCSLNSFLLLFSLPPLSTHSTDICNVTTYQTRQHVVRSTFHTPLPPLQEYENHNESILAEIQVGLHESLVVGKAKTYLVFSLDVL